MNSPGDPLDVAVATCLEADDWLSIKRCNRHILAALARRSTDVRVRRVEPTGHAVRSDWIRAVVRRTCYPFVIRQIERHAGPRTVLHVTDQFYAYLIPSRLPSVVTCHDIADFKHTDLTPAQLRRWKRRVSNIARARVIFADSRCTQSDISDTFGVSHERILVNPLGIDASFRPLPDGHAMTPLGKRLQQLATQHVLLLHVGSNLGRKNLHTLLRAMARLVDAGISVKLIKVGDPMLDGANPALSDLCDVLHLRDRIVDLGRVGHEELIEAYSLCRIFLFPSIYEGFGFPLLEAQACGCPCVAAHASSLPEIGADAVLYHEPTDPAQAAAAVTRILNDPTLRASLVSRGIDNAGRFTWDAHADRLIAGYRMALDPRP